MVPRALAVVPDAGPLLAVGHAERADRRGRGPGSCTADVRIATEVLARRGVYAGRVDGAPAVLVVGVRATAGGLAEPCVEAQVLDVPYDDYGREVDVEILRFVREERSFADDGAGVAQRDDDVRRVRRLLAEDEADARIRVAAAVDELHAGRAVVLLGDGADSDAASLVVAAEHADAAAVNRLVRDAGGIVSLVLSDTHCDRLGLPLLRDGVHDTGRRRFTVSIDARHGVSSGTSAADRAVTIAAAMAPGARSRDVAVPGHVFPVRAADGGVLGHAGQPEASLDLTRLGALAPGAVVCTMLDADGAIASERAATDVARARGLRVVSVRDVLTYRRAIERGAGAEGVIDLGVVRAVAFEAGEGGRVALVMGEVAGGIEVAVRMVDGTDGALADALSSLKLEGGGVALTPPSGPFDDRVAGRVAAGFASLGIVGIEVAGDPRLAMVEALLRRIRA